MMNLPTDLQDRWQLFLSKISERFRETLDQAATILPQLLDYRQFDTVPFANAWTGIQSQAQALISKIEDTWQGTVSGSWEQWKDEEEDRLNNAEEDMTPFHEAFYKVYFAERQKGYQLMQQLETDLRNYEVRTFAEAGRKLAAKAREILSGDFACTQCQAPLPVQENFYRSYYQVCGYCQTTNTFEPGTIARMVEHFAVGPIAEEKSLAEYAAYDLLLQQFKAQGEGDPVTVTADQVMESYAAYADAFLKARIAMIPAYQERYEADKKAKLEWLRKYTLHQL